MLIIKQKHILVDYPIKYKCKGEYNHWICNFRAEDIPKIGEKNTHCLMGNKFNIDIDPNAVKVQLKNVLDKTLFESSVTQKHDYV